jgi:hypothetical protein
MEPGELANFVVFWAIFLAACAFVASLMHRFILSSWVANLSTAVVIVVGLACADRIKQGYFFDGWFVIARINAAIIAFALGVSAGRIMDSRGLSRRTRVNNHGP